MRWTLSLLLLISTLFCLGCNSSRGTPDDLVWLQPIEFSKETKEWLGGLNWPPSAYADFDKIVKLNKKIQLMKELATAQ